VIRNVGRVMVCSKFSTSATTNCWLVSSQNYDFIFRTGTRKLLLKTFRTYFPVSTTFSVPGAIRDADNSPPKRFVTDKHVASFRLVPTWHLARQWLLVSGEKYKYIIIQKHALLFSRRIYHRNFLLVLHCWFYPQSATEIK
jgi:hypothetical protein